MPSLQRNKDVHLGPDRLPPKGHWLVSPVIFLRTFSPLSIAKTIHDRHPSRKDITEKMVTRVLDGTEWPSRGLLLLIAEAVGLSPGEFIDMLLYIEPSTKFIMPGDKIKEEV